LAETLRASMRLRGEGGGEGGGQRALPMSMASAQAKAWHERAHLLTHPGTSWHPDVHT
jgi:hypothetical protein